MTIILRGRRRGDKYSQGATNLILMGGLTKLLLRGMILLLNSMTLSIDF